MALRVIPYHAINSASHLSTLRQIKCKKKNNKHHVFVRSFFSSMCKNIIFEQKHSQFCFRFLLLLFFYAMRFEYCPPKFIYILLAHAAYLGTICIATCLIRPHIRIHGIIIATVSNCPKLIQSSTSAGG